MARIKGVSPAQAELYARIACYVTRRSLGRLAGREPERMLEPLVVYAHMPPAGTTT